MKAFEEAWKFVKDKALDRVFPVVQDKSELEYIFNLMIGSNSYLEVGTAEGCSMYVLAHAMPNKSWLHWIDLGEKHTQAYREEFFQDLSRIGYNVSGMIGNSNELNMTNELTDKVDCVMIDAGHLHHNALLDLINYGKLATKYIFVHDVTMPDVMKAFCEYALANPHLKPSTFIRSTTYGYGIFKV